MKFSQFAPALLVAAVALVIPKHINAAWIDQPFNIVVIGPFQSNSTVVASHPLGPVIEMNQTNVVKAIVEQLGTNYTNFYNWHLYHRIDTNTLQESIVIRNLTNTLDVSDFFPGFENNFAATDLVTNNTTAYGLHTLNFVSSNLAFTLSGFGTQTPTKVSKVSTNLTPPVIRTTGVGSFMVNIGNPATPTNMVIGPASGRFSIGGGLLRTNH